MKNKQSLKSFVGFIVEFVLGLLFVLFPTQFQNFIIYVFGAVLILLGLVQILVYLFGKIRSPIFSFSEFCSFSSEFPSSF